MAHRNRKADREMVQGILLGDPGFLKEIGERALQELLEAEMTEHLGAAPYGCAENRRVHRNGHKPRMLRSRVGTLNLLVPKAARGHSPPASFAATNATRRPWSWRSWRCTSRGFRPGRSRTSPRPCAARPSPRVRSPAWPREPRRRTGSVEGAQAGGRGHPYLFVDARYEKARIGGRVVSQGVLVISAVRADGFGEIVGIAVADTESEATYQELFRSLKVRGLSGVELVVSDDHPLDSPLSYPRSCSELLKSWLRMACSPFSSHQSLYRLYRRDDLTFPGSLSHS
jgi:putative transposase